MVRIINRRSAGQGQPEGAELEGLLRESVREALRKELASFLVTEKELAAVTQRERRGDGQPAGRGRTDGSSSPAVQGADRDPAALLGELGKELIALSARLGGRGDEAAGEGQSPDQRQVDGRELARRLTANLWRLKQLVTETQHLTQELQVFLENSQPGEEH
mgnify:CR=1 FL=1